MTIEVSPKEYLSLFDKKKQALALETAHDVRKFEIELYWKRASYFWALIVVTFAGYFTTQGDDNHFAAVCISYLGFFISLSWYFVNRGSARWQQNWETQVDLLEDDISGPLHKTTRSTEDYAILNWLEAYPFSPTRTNAMVSIFVTLSWIPLIAKSNIDVFLDDSVSMWSARLEVLLGLMTIVGVSMLWKIGRAKSRRTGKKLVLKLRGYNRDEQGHVVKDTTN